ncbi:hypothetical protein niasHS_008330 [Heterodera schachtii]|uniref:RING-type domain-containing protein n=1 Tax=Heterodera schachtii TaxID=97005 RepID=A0ABD2IXI9_HETSC
MNEFGSQSADSYHITQISPPGTYRVVIWSQLLLGANFFGTQITTPNECNENEIFAKIWMGRREKKMVFRLDILQKENFDELAKCFAHFYSVITDENGKFLLAKNGTLSKKLGFFSMLMDGTINLHLIPMKKEGMAIDFGDYWPTFPFQQMYSLANRTPIDTLCTFDNLDSRHCLLKYFKAFNEKKEIFSNTLRHWLFGIQFRELSEMDNFFLLGILKESLDQCQMKRLSGQRMETENAILIGVFWSFFGDKKNRIMKRLRLADGQMVDLIWEFCRINRNFLYAHQSVEDQTQSSEFDYSFCDQWPTVYKKSLQYTQFPVVLDAFSKWLQLSYDHSHGKITELILPPSPNCEEISDEMQQIIKMWFEIIIDRIHNWHHRMNKWPEVDRNIFAQIGTMLAAAQNYGILTVPMLNVVQGSLESLEKICVGQEFIWNTKSEEEKAYLWAWRMFCKYWNFQPNETQQPIDQAVANTLQMANFSGPSDEAESSNKEKSAKNKGKNKIEEKEQPQNNTNQNNECVVCFKEKIEVIFLPCGHAFACQNCANKIGKSCAICRNKITDSHRIYLP